MEYGQLHLPAKESGRFALVPGELGELSKLSLPVEEFGSLGSALSAGSGIKTYNQSRGK